MKRTNSTLDSFLIKTVKNAKSSDLSGSEHMSFNQTSTSSAPIIEPNLLPVPPSPFDIGNILQLNCQKLTEDMKLNFLTKTWTPSSDYW
jgi:hypothetical protein